MAHQNIINSVCYSANGRLIASASDDETIGLWDAITGQSLRSTFTNHTDGVLIVGFVTDSRTVVSLSRDGTVLVWKATTGEVERQSQISLDARSLATLSNDGKKLLAADRRGITVWNTSTMESIKTFAPEGPMVLCMGLSQDTTKVVFGMGDNSIHLWDLENDEADSPYLEGGTELPIYLAWSPDGRTVSSVAQDATLRVWSVESRQCMLESHRTNGPIAYSPGSSFIVFPSDNGSPDTWQVPETSHHDSTFLLDLPATAISTHPAAGAAESNAFWGVSSDFPAANTQRTRRPRGPEGTPRRNTPLKTRGFFLRTLRRVFVRGGESSAIAAAKYKNVCLGYCYNIYAFLISDSQLLWLLGQAGEHLNGDT
ncbi:WD40-repeat-containing domain protein [Pisolithus sp. B1]|nr:WD40-repeat-containing domain protein [Pisolithus sp. B1]